jgi:gliding motility-associated-like protein
MNKKSDLMKNKKTVFQTISTTFLCLFLTCSLMAQNLDDGLIAHFPFDGYPIVDKSGNGNKAISNGDTTLACGAEGNSLRFDGLSTGILFIGPAVFDNFKTGPFAVSFYFKPSNQVGNATLDILSKRQGCNSDSVFAIRYTPVSNTISVELSENVNNRSVIVQRLDFNRCWQHIVVVREFQRLALYINGRLAQTSYAPKRVNITNAAPLRLAGSPCLTTTDRRFSGFLDELRIYNRPLTDDEVGLLYRAPDRIANKDTIMFLGSTINVNSTNTCATDFKWTPAADVDSPLVAKTIIKPRAGGYFKYVLTMKEAQCTSVDTLRVTVIDPKTLACDQVFLPKAFTPNGDGPNDYFFISNPYAIEELLDFEILDAWGARMFYTVDKFAKWDGTFGGKSLNPGVYVWKTRFKCKDEIKSNFGSVTIIK